MKGKMREARITLLKSECDRLRIMVENLEADISDSEIERQKEKEMKYLARLIYAGKILEKLELLYSFNLQSLFETLTTNKDEIPKDKS